MEELRSNKTAMIAALWANGNIGGDDLTGAVGELEDNFRSAVDQVYGGPDVDEIDWDDPFFAKARSGVQDIERRMKDMKHQQQDDEVEASDIKVDQQD